MNVKKFRETEFASFQLKDIEKWVNVYYKEFVVHSLESLDFDVLEILELGVFEPKKKSLIKLIRTHFNLRREFKNTEKVAQIEATLKKYIKQYWYLRNENEKRKKFGIKKRIV